MCAAFRVGAGGFGNIPDVYNFRQSPRFCQRDPHSVEICQSVHTGHRLHPVPSTGENITGFWKGPAVSGCPRSSCEGMNRESNLRAGRGAAGTVAEEAFESTVKAVLEIVKKWMMG